jgi:hypothetical protein
MTAQKTLGTLQGCIAVLLKDDWTSHQIREAVETALVEEGGDDMTEQSETPFRVYTLDADGDPKCLAACDDVSLADVLLAQAKEGVRVDGIMYRPIDGEPGIWLISPWA